MEQVLAVKSQILDPLLGEDPLVTRDTEKIFQTILDHHQFLPRPQAEEDFSYRQIIPYVVIRQGDRAFLLRRLKKQTEKRLHGLLSLGVGGHINPPDEAAANVLEAGLRRELQEEVDLASIDRLQFVGVINDRSSEVSRVHVGLLYLLDTQGPVSVRETEKMAGEFVPISDLPALAGEMETWSQIALEGITGELPHEKNAR